jgi:uncharacterized membrane protein
VKASLRDLQARVDRLERQVARLGAESQSASDPRVSRQELPQAERPRSPETRVLPAGASSGAEEELLGKWFPRLGALAIVLGAGFGFRYAVDRGWVGPGLRVAVGIVMSFALLGLGEWTRRRRWSSPAQAISGGGIALLYLTLWACLHLYGFLSSSETFALLLGVSALGAGLALHHNSQTLAAVALLGGFINPFVTGIAPDMPVGLYLYALGLDVAVLGLSLVRDWRVLEKIAFAGSWILFAVGEGSRTTSLTAATVTFVIFGALPYIRVFVRKSVGGFADFSFLVTNGFLYYGAVMVRLTGDLADLRGSFTLSLAIVYAGAAFCLRNRSEDFRVLRYLTSGMALFFAIAWVPVELEERFVALAWALEALVLVAAGGVTRSPGPRVAGWLVATLAIVFQLGSMSMDPAGMVEDHFGRIVLTVILVTLYLSAYLDARIPVGYGPDMGVGAIAAANVLSVVWLSFELYAALSPGSSTRADPAELQFGLSALWSLYAAGLLCVGFVIRSKTARMLAVALFGVTLIKMTGHDLWLLDSLQRLVGFAGIGALLLVASLGYQRFKDLLSGSPESAEDHSRRV